MDFFSILDGITGFAFGDPPKAPEITTEIQGGLPLDEDQERWGDALCYKGNQVELLVAGHEALPKMIEAIDNAKHHIHIQTMTFADDNIGQLLAQKLIKKAQEGVKVRILFEFFTTAIGDLTFSKGTSIDPLMPFIEKMRGSGIEVVDSGAFPISTIDKIETNLIVASLRNMAKEEIKLFPDTLQQKTKKLDDKWLEKMTSFVENHLPTAASTFDDLLQKFGGVGTKISTKINLFRRFMVHDHRKIVVVDGKIGFCGGMNIGQEYLYQHPYDANMPSEKEKDTSHNPEPWEKWRDVHARVQGGAVNRLQRLFLNRWHANKGIIPQLHEARYYFPKPDHPGNSKVWVLANAPSGERQISNRLLLEMFKAKESIWMTNPYLVSDDFIGMVLSKADSIENIGLLVPDDHNDSKVHQMVIRGCYKWYKDKKINIYELQNHFTHAKVAVVDNYLTHIGSCNFNYRSTNMDYECSLFIEDKDFAQTAIDRVFSQPIKDGYAKVPEHAVNKLFDVDLIIACKKFVELCPDIF